MQVKHSDIPNSHHPLAPSRALSHPLAPSRTCTHPSVADQPGSEAASHNGAGMYGDHPWGKLWALLQEDPGECGTSAADLDLAYALAAEESWEVARRGVVAGSSSDVYMPPAAPPSGEAGSSSDVYTPPAAPPSAVKPVMTEPKAPTKPKRQPRNTVDMGCSRPSRAPAMRAHRATLAANTTDEEKTAAMIRANAMKVAGRKRTKLNKLGDKATEAERVWLAANPGRVVKPQVVKPHQAKPQAKPRAKRVQAKRVRCTIKRDGEEKFAASSECKPTLKRNGEEFYRQTPAGQKSAIDSARVLAARGAGETLDDLTEEQREAMGARVGAEVSQYTDEALSKDDNAVAYIAVGGWERMVVNLQAAEANSWNYLSKCEILASLLRTNPAVLVLVDGKAQKFTSAHIRKVRAEPPLTSASPCSASPILQPSPAAPPTPPDPTPPRLSPTHPCLVTGPGGRPHQGPCLLDAHAQLVHGEGI